MKRLLLAGALLLVSGPASAARLPIIASQDWWPVWSPDGTKVAFTRVEQRTMTLYVRDLVAHQTYRIASNQGQLSPSWSSQGKITYSAGGDIHTADADGAHRIRVIEVGRSYAPAWRPHSLDIAYVSTRGGAQNIDLWVNGTLWAREVIGTPAWSPDGSRLAFQRNDGIYAATGPNAESRVATSVNPGAPAWSPDGSTIAYAAAHRIWIVPADGSATPRALTPTMGILGTPSWSREADAVTFTANGAVWVAYLDGRAVKLIDGGVGGAAFSPSSDVVAFSGERPTCAGHAGIRVYYDNSSNGPVTGSCEIDGTPGNDVIQGTGAGGDVIVAGAGSDVIRARNGHRDTILCGPGRDTVYADRFDVLRGCEIVHRP